MNLALVLGRSSSSIEPKLSKVRDNLNIESFVDIQRFISGTIKMELTYDRVIILATLIKSDDYIEDLYRFWKSYISDAEIVLLCRAGADDELAKSFLNRFCSVSVTSMSVTSTTLNTIAEAVVLPIREIIKRYGIEDYLAVEVEKDVYEDPKPEVVRTDNSVSMKSEGGIQEDNGKKKKRSLLGVLFGGRNKSKQQNSEKTNISQNNLTSDDLVEDTNILPKQEEVLIQQDYVPQEQVKSCDTDISTNEYNDFTSDLETENLATSNENFEENIDDASLDDGFKDDEVFQDTDLDVDDSNSDDSSSCNDTFEEPLEDLIDDNEDEPLEDLVNDNTDDPLEDLDDILEIVEDDFGDLLYTGGVDPVQPTDGFDVQESSIDDVEDIEANLSVGSAEAEYRKKTETPKIIKETVVKEVIKKVNTSSTLDSLYKGLLNKIIIVTGDRGSGVTTFAWSLALHFSEKIPVLYFDCDVENHGLMNYIDYFDFKNYELTHSQGVKLCRNSDNFNSCVCRWNTNIDLLTSDFGINVTDEELIDCQGVVAENMNKYGVVIVDCPLSKLHCLQDLILTGNVAFCIEDSKRGYMNAFLNIDKSNLNLRYRRSIISRGTIVRTKVNPRQDYKRLTEYIKDIVDFEGCNWLEMRKTEFKGKVTKDLLKEILEV